MEGGALFRGDPFGTRNVRQLFAYRKLFRIHDRPAQVGEAVSTSGIDSSG